jgi:hypothetical protein
MPSVRNVLAAPGSICAAWSYMRLGAGEIAAKELGAGENCIYVSIVRRHVHGTAGDRLGLRQGGIERHPGKACRLEDKNERPVRSRRGPAPSNVRQVARERGGLRKAGRQG